MARGATVRADAIVVAAGASRRMDGVDKLRAPLLGRPLLAWTLDALAASGAVERLVIVAAPDEVERLSAEPWLRAHDATVVAGGERRQESVAAGVAASDGELILVHDGARPLATPGLVAAVASAAAEAGAAVPVVSLVETIKRVEDERVAETVERDGLAAAQTPQGVRRELLVDAYSAIDPYGPRTFTDESALLEAHGVAVVVVEGEPDNLKVTRPADLARATAILAARLGHPRVGIGRDSHAFGPRDGLALGGIVIPEAPRLDGHSDGDAALHAVADALLGASGGGDLGRLFPATDPATEGVDSGRLLAEVVARVGDAGLRPANLDLTIVCGRPRLGAERLEHMRDRIAELLELDRGSVSVKASTGNLDGPEGAGRSISAIAIVSLVAR
jgi:2-C-methyl-D-erythritol 4-phosphate cytidylyltransferase/2-C-methyl-D-erythritol 2,4-cyclodiphosphate synthase